MFSSGLMVDVIYTKPLLKKASASTALWNIPQKPLFGALDFNDYSRKSYVSFLSDNKFASMDDVTLAATAGLIQSIESTDVSENSRREGDKKRINNKALIRKKWNSIRDDLDQCLNMIHSGDTKPTAEGVIEILHAASNIEPLVETPGETFVSTMNSDLTEMAQHMGKVYMWIATLHDMLGNVTPLSEADLPKLHAHLEDANTLPIRCPEEAILRSLLDKISSWLMKATELMTLINSTTEQIKSNSTPTIKKANKPDLKAAEQLLHESKAIPVTLSLQKELSTYFSNNIMIHESINDFLAKASLARQRKPGRGEKMVLDVALNLCASANNCSFYLPRAWELQQIIDECLKWKSLVAVSLKADNVSLKKVEAFIADGEILPFQCNEELTLLREKKALAKTWLEKLKKSFLKTSRNTRKTGGDSEKLSLEQMRDMVFEGSTLYDNPAQNKDLRRASAVVEVADEVSRCSLKFIISKIYIIYCCLINI